MVSASSMSSQRCSACNRKICLDVIKAARHPSEFVAAFQEKGVTYLDLRYFHFPDKTLIAPYVDKYSISLSSHSLTKISLSNCHITDLQIDMIFSSIHQTVRSLNLYSNEIYQNGARSIGLHLRSNSTLQALRLDSNHIKDEGAKHLAQALRENSSLTKLSLKSTHLTHVGFKHLCEGLKFNTTLTSLDLWNNRGSCQGVQHFTEYLSQSPNPALERLNLQANNIGMHGFSSIATALSMNTVLKHLHLSGKFGQPFKGFENLDQGAIEIAQSARIHDTLKSLSITNSGLTAIGVKAIAEYLKESTSLTSLNLSCNRDMGDEGGKAIASALRTNSILEELYLASTGLTIDGVGPIVYCLYRNSATAIRVMDMSHSRFVSTLNKLTVIPSLATLLYNNTTLQSLRLKQTLVLEYGNDLGPALKHNTTLTELDISDNDSLRLPLFSRKKDASVIPIADALRTNSTLTKLDMYGINYFYPAVTEALSQALKTNQALRTLNLGSTIGVTGEVQEKLSNASHDHPTLEEFDIRGFDRVKRGHIH